MPAPIEFEMSNTQSQTTMRLEQSGPTSLSCLVNGSAYTLFNCSASKDGSAWKAKVGFLWMTHDVLGAVDKVANTGTIVISNFETLSGTFDNPTEGATVDAFIAACGFPPLAE
jgi:hypothetical protein